MSKPFSSTIQKVHSVAFHRNGMTGCPFYVVLFTSREEPGRKVGIVFMEDGDEDGMQERTRAGDRHVAVMDVKKLARDVIAFGDDGNSYRGDYFTPCLVKAIRAYQSRAK